MTLTKTRLAAPPAAQMAIATDSLRKVYKGRAVVQGLTLNVGPGEVFGFLGPNGAGKSTTIKMLLGLVMPHLRYGLGAGWFAAGPRRPPPARVSARTVQISDLDDRPGIPELSRAAGGRETG